MLQFNMVQIPKVVKKRRHCGVEHSIFKSDKNLAAVVGIEVASSSSGSSNSLSSSSSGSRISEVC